jgi:hypothetical protein
LPAVSARLASQLAALPRARSRDADKLRKLVAYLSRASQRLGELRENVV